MKLYVASSWRNASQPEVVTALRTWGHEVYDFRNEDGFHWSAIDGGWKAWTPEHYREILRAHPLCEKGFGRDWDAMVAAEGCVLVNPCGRSAHLEAGYFVGARKPLFLLLAKEEPELMYRMATALCLTLAELHVAIQAYEHIVRG